jgi:NTE family protein
MLPADLVLQGGGVKGIALAGAVTRLMKMYTFRRIGGTSAGAILASLIAAGYSADEVRELMSDLPYAKVPDAGGLPIVSPTLSLVGADGLFKGDFIRDWVRDRLADKNVHTFGDLRLKRDPKADAYMSGDRAFKLVVTATDVTRGRALRLPWDYRDAFGLEPAAQPVAEAVRMSLSIPLFFRPCRLAHARTNQASMIVDGGVLSNFPVEMFDRQDGEKPRWPTLGIGVIPDLPGGDGTLVPYLPTALPGPLGLLMAVAVTAVCGHDQTYLGLPRNADRVMRIDTSGVGVVSFGIGAAGRDRLFANGDATCAQFLKTWNWEGYLKRYYSDPSAPSEPSGTTIAATNLSSRRSRPTSAP